MLISETEVMNLLVGACPSFARAWAEARADADFDSSLLHVHLGELAAHLIERLRRDDASECVALFAAVERLFVEGDEDVREAATLGLLDGLQSAAGTAGVSPARFVDLFQPATRRRWDELERFWAGQLSYVGRGGNRSGEE